MKVDSTNQTRTRSLQDGFASTQQSESASTASTGAAAASAQSTPAPQSSGGDANVSLSSASSQLRTAASSDAADIDTAQVESIKSAIRNGTLQIDTGKIADGVLETARNLLAPSSAS